ncbi:hypothetical protein [Rhizobium sp. 18065]|uniref:hypothetical protein n=1 Tax=Rhizobium sp. 18065 TaxID=2681411 RepID=UPI00135915C2|nr:hypothetical protein [Rhizobium sp. 18065]
MTTVEITAISTLTVALNGIATKIERESAAASDARAELDTAERNIAELLTFKADLEKAISLLEAVPETSSDQTAA